MAPPLCRPGLPLALWHWLPVALTLTLMLLLEQGEPLRELLEQGEEDTAPLLQEEGEREVLAEAEAEGLDTWEAEPMEAL